MNIPNLRALADDLRAKPLHQFHLGFWFGRSHSEQPGLFESFKPSCQTCACIAGDTLMLFDPNTWTDTSEVSRRAAEILGLNSMQAASLFTPLRPYCADDPEPYQLPFGRGFDSITPQEAARVIDRLIETGGVDWRIIA